MDLTDEALAEKFRQTGDPALFRLLIRRYEVRLYNAAFRILGNSEEAEEVVQDTCMKVHQNMQKFNGRSTFNSWLFHIAHNTCMDKMRTRRKWKGFRFLAFDPQSGGECGEEEAPYVVSQVCDPAPNPAELLETSEQSALVNELIKQLPVSQRTVVVLHDIEGFSYVEISEIIGASLGTVRSRLHYGRLRLRQLLEPYFSRTGMTSISR